MVQRINELSSRIKFEEEDKCIFNDKFGLSDGHKPKFPKEEFENYDIIRRNSLTSLSIFSGSGSGKDLVKISQPTHVNLVEDPNKSIKLQELTNSIKELYEKIFGEETLKEELISSIIEKLKDTNDFTYCLFLVDILLSQEKNNLCILFKNFKNMQSYAKMLNIVGGRICNKGDDNFEMNFALLFIGERSYCLRENNKFYLCNLLATLNKKLYNSKHFWINLISLKIETKVTDLYKNFSSKIKPYKTFL